MVKNPDTTLELEAAYAQCVVLLAEFVNAVQLRGVCLMCRSNITTQDLNEHKPGCAVRRADAFIRHPKSGSNAARR